MTRPAEKPLVEVEALPPDALPAFGLLSAAPEPASEVGVGLRVGRVGSDGGGGVGCGGAGVSFTRCDVSRKWQNTVIDIRWIWCYINSGKIVGSNEAHAVWLTHCTIHVAHASFLTHIYHRK
ncbi:hypothetical protein [Atopobium deltae]|uniref:hypothetical protein n=1 Tax=Atopobium deltae TaxID=1393034 RepID=UPI0012E340E4|nr:hypothetical protein [Atopobium deltae]